jgi:thioester reductase-like protein
MPLRRNRYKWEDNIKMYLRGVDWIHHGLDRDQWLALVNTVL